MTAKSVKAADKQTVVEEQVAEKEDDNVLHFSSPQGHVRDRILIHPNPNIPKEGVFISLNGYAFLAKAGVEIDIPRPLREMLDTRIQTETTQDAEGNNHVRDIPRFTYQVVKLAVNMDELVKQGYMPDGPAIEAGKKAEIDLFEDGKKG